MIKGRGTFPHSGSFALHNAFGGPQLVRIIANVGEVATISYPLIPSASGTTQVAAEMLVDGTPLSEDERFELTELERALHGKTRPSKSKLRRAQYLAFRDIHCRQLEDKLKEAVRRRLLDPVTAGFEPRQRAAA